MIDDYFLIVFEKSLINFYADGLLFLDLGCLDSEKKQVFIKADNFKNHSVSIYQAYTEKHDDISDKIFFIF